MKEFGGVLLIAVLAYSCSRPIANFTLSASHQSVPSVITATSESVNADSLSWEINGDAVRGDSVLTKRMFLSGKHTVKLMAQKGRKKSIMEKEVLLNPPKECLVELRTPMGSMLIQLFDETPIHRDNFVKLVEEGYYNGLLFHRIMQGFMVQGGDPNSRNSAPGQRLGTGGPGYQIKAEFSKELIHRKGALAAARTPDEVNPEKKSSGSQFYIVQGSEIPDWQLNQIENRKNIQYTEESRKAYTEFGGTPFLDMEYTVFAQVIEGLDVIDKLAEVRTDQADRPLEDIKMEIVLIK